MLAGEIDSTREAVSAILLWANADQADLVRESAAHDPEIHILSAASLDELMVLDLGQIDVVLAWDRDGRAGFIPEQLAAAGHWLPVLAIGEQLNIRRVVSAIAAGVADYIDWPAEAGRLSLAIHAAHQAKQSKAARIDRLTHARAVLSKLSPRERQVLACMADGLTNKLIARSLNISPRTVEIHRAHMLDKLKSKSSADAIRMAFEAVIPIQFAPAVAAEDHGSAEARLRSLPLG
ncbi:MAG TPA: LuxR C-terminal-related transcriptional regulator [Croceibacterium sp.]|nr:LuxR C-terminal-related transcriptional regulator [Croceibacterium sp.]